jgi:hypothetical protein
MRDPLPARRFVACTYDDQIRPCRFRTRIGEVMGGCPLASALATRTLVKTESVTVARTAPAEKETVTSRYWKHAGPRDEFG